MAKHVPDRSLGPDDPGYGSPGNSAPAVEWFYTQRGETYGPVSGTDLRAAAHLGFLGPDDLVRRTDRERWVPARSIHGLFKEVG